MSRELVAALEERLEGLNRSLASQSKLLHEYFQQAHDAKGRVAELEKRCEEYRRHWDDEKTARQKLESEAEDLAALIHELRELVRACADGGPIAALKELIAKYDPTGEL